MHYRDFPLSMRVLLAGTILLLLMNAILFLVGITGLHPVWLTPA